MREAPSLRSRYPGYDVLEKRNTPSWNAKTREIVANRLAIGLRPKFFTVDEFSTVAAIAARIVPQAEDRPPVPVAGLIDDKLHKGRQDGFRRDGMPKEGEAWRIALAALDAEAEAAHEKPFRDLDGGVQDGLLRRMKKGDLTAEAWRGLSPANLFTHRIARDAVFAYYAHPTAWSEIGWGGPASPRGYVRMDYDERDPWEAEEVRDGDAIGRR